MNIHYSTLGEYWLQTGPGQFTRMEKSDLKLHAIREGIKEKPEPNLTAFESILYRAQCNCVVKYAGSLAGHRSGVLSRNSGDRLLVTDQCNAFIKSRPLTRQQTFITTFIDTLFIDGHDHVIAWLAVAYQSLIKQDYSPGQMLALAGPPACGKSFFHYLVTELLGGRMAKPYSYLTGRTAFNGDLARAEHLVIEDEVASSDIRARRNFGSALKQFTVGEDMHVHDKGKIAFTAPTFKRLTLSVNDEPENLMILPPFDSSIADKVMLLKCKDAKPVLSEDRAKNKAMIAAELPAFRAWLLKHRVPKEIRCPRFGVVAWHNAELLAMVSETQPEQRLAHLIQEVVTDSAWRGSATELEMLLRNSPFAQVAQGLFYYPTACGVYLSRLAVKFPERFRQVRMHGQALWEIVRIKDGVRLSADQF